MQLLCQWEVQGDESAERMREYFAEHESPARAGDYAARLLESFWARRQAVDAAITGAARNWSLERISTVERNILRVAALELILAEVPPKVVIDEAIEIGGEFGGKDSGRFINGLLDEIRKSQDVHVLD